MIRTFNSRLIFVLLLSFRAGSGRKLAYFKLENSNIILTPTDASLSLSLSLSLTRERVECSFLSVHYEIQKCLNGIS